MKFTSNYSSLMTINTPIKIQIVPNQNSTPIVSPKSSQPKKVPTIGCKKKNNPPLEAFMSCKPLFHNKKPHAVEIMPKYKIPPKIVGSKITCQFNCASLGNARGVNKITAKLDV